MGERVQGDPARLEGYSQATLDTIAPTVADVESYSAAVKAFNAAEPNDLGTYLIDRSGSLQDDLDALGHFDAKPAAFAFALRQLDHFMAAGPGDRAWLVSADLELFDALADARLANPWGSDGDVVDQALNALTGTPEELAAELRGLIKATDGLSEKDTEDLQSKLREYIKSDISAPVSKTWERSLRGDDLDALDPGVLAHLRTTMAKLENVKIRLRVPINDYADQRL